jgi:hypothetical protein
MDLIRNVSGYLPFLQNSFLVRQTAVIFIFLLGVREIRNRVVVPLMFVPSIFISRVQKAHFVRARESLQTKPNCKLIDFHAADGTRLNGFQWLNPDLNQEETKSLKWVLWFNPNAALYEDEAPFLKNYGRNLGANVFAFNYRGVGLSESSPRTVDDLYADGIAAMNFLLSKGTSPDNILIHGHSLGA